MKQSLSGCAQRDSVIAVERAVANRNVTSCDDICAVQAVFICMCITDGYILGIQDEQSGIVNEAGICGSVGIQDAVRNRDISGGCQRSAPQEVIVGGHCIQGDAAVRNHGHAVAEEVRPHLLLRPREDTVDDRHEASGIDVHAGSAVSISNDVHQGDAAAARNIQAHILAPGICRVAHVGVHHSHVAARVNRRAGLLILPEVRIHDGHIATGRQVSAGTIGGIRHIDILEVDIHCRIQHQTRSAGAIEREITERERATPRVPAGSDDERNTV